jgi:hypothetical protein
MTRRPSPSDLNRRLEDLEGDGEHPPLTQLYADIVHAASGGDSEQVHDRLENAPDEVLAQLVGRGDQA